MKDRFVIWDFHCYVRRMQTIVIGHKNPDMDAICSAIAYADFKRRLTAGEPLFGIFVKTFSHQIVEVLGLATSTVSRHASILQQARLVESRKAGRWTYFRLDDDAPPQAREAVALAARALTRDRRTREDARRLRQVLKIDPAELCRGQNACKC